LSSFLASGLAHAYSWTRAPSAFLTPVRSSLFMPSFGQADNFCNASGLIFRKSLREQGFG